MSSRAGYCTRQDSETLQDVLVQAYNVLLRGNACACLNCGLMKCSWRISKEVDTFGYHGTLNRSLELGRNLDSGRQPPEYGRAAVTKRGVRLLKWG